MIIFGKSNHINEEAMIHVRLPEAVADASRRLPFYLAMEEHLARNYDGEYFFMWQVEPTVIFGRNQQIEAEVNLDYCRREGIQTYRRKSGGGCVFADMNNIMFSHVTTCESVATTFRGFTSRVASMLRCLGLDAGATGRNDILIGDRKVSGYAFYHIPIPGGTGALSRAIVHGTMLYDADLERMTAALTPSQTKLDAKGVKSVRSRVTTIRENHSIGLQDFKSFAVAEICDGEMVLTDADIEEINRIAAPYFEERWIYGRRYGSGRNALPNPVRIEGAGEFVVDLQTSPGSPHVISNVDLKGDFFITGDLDATLLRRLQGVPLTRGALLSAMEGVNVPGIIMGLSAGQLADLLLAAK